MPKKYVCSDPNRPICKQGLLRKKGGSHGGFQTWNSRYFVIDFEHLAYYKNKKAYFDNATPIRVIPRKQLSAVPAAPKQHIFGGSTDCQFELVTNELTPQGQREIRVLLDAGTLENRNEWVSVINFVHAITPLAGFPSVSLDDVAARKVSLFTQRAHDVLKSQFFLPAVRENSPLGVALAQPLDVKAPKDLGCRSLADFFEFLRKRATEELSSGAYNTPLPPAEPSPVSKTAMLHQSNSSFTSTKTSPKLRKYHSSRPDALHASDTEIVLSEDSSYGEASDDNLSQDGKFYDQEPGYANPLYSFSQPAEGEKKHHRSPSARSNSKEKKKHKPQPSQDENTTLDLPDEKTLLVEDLPPSARSSVSSMAMASRILSERNASHTRLSSAHALPSQSSMHRKPSASKKYDSKTLSADIARAVAMRAKTDHASHRSMASTGSGGRPSHSPANSQVILGNFRSDSQPTHRRSNSGFNSSPGHSVSAEQRSGASSLRSTPNRADTYRVRDSAPLLLSQARAAHSATLEMDPEFEAPRSAPPSPPPPPPPFYESESDVPLPPPIIPAPAHLSPVRDYESTARSSQSSRSSRVAKVQLMSQTLPTPMRALQFGVPQYAEPVVSHHAERLYSNSAVMSTNNTPLYADRMYSNSTVVSTSEYEPYRADRSRSNSRFSVASSFAPSSATRGKPRYSTATLPRNLSRTLSANSQRSLANLEAALHRPPSPTISQPDITDFEDMGGAPTSHHFVELDGISAVPLPPPPSMTSSRTYNAADFNDELSHKLRSRAKLFS